MDKSFNGLRYSSSQGCLVDDNGESFRMRQSSTQIFLFLTQNLNELVSRERLLNNLLGKLHAEGDRLDDSLNECIDEIRHVVGNDRLKTIPSVGYLLTPDTATDTAMTDTAQPYGIHAAPAGSVASRAPSLAQELFFYSQWLTSAYQKRPHAWIASLLLIAAVVISTAGASVNTTSGHIAFDREDTNVCSRSVAGCTNCMPNYWQRTSVQFHSTWFLSSGCNPR